MIDIHSLIFVKYGYITGHLNKIFFCPKCHQRQKVKTILNNLKLFRKKTAITIIVHDRECCFFFFTGMFPPFTCST